MRTLIVAVAVMLLAGTAQAETIVDACERVAALEFGVDVTSSDVQAFPELDPPRVRMRVHAPASSGRVPGPDRIAAMLEGRTINPDQPADHGMVMCRFERAEKPFGLTYFECAGMACFITPERLEELQTLLARDGY